MPYVASHYEISAAAPKGKGDPTIAKGTIIATSSTGGVYHGHAAVFVSQSAAGITLLDQWVTGKPKPIGPHVIGWNGHGVNNGNSYYVVE